MHGLVARLVQPHQIRESYVSQAPRLAVRNEVPELEEVLAEAVVRPGALDEVPLPQDGEQAVRGRLG